MSDPNDAIEHFKENLQSDIKYYQEQINKKSQRFSELSFEMGEAYEKMGSAYKKVRKYKEAFDWFWKSLRSFIHESNKLPSFEKLPRIVEDIREVVVASGQNIIPILEDIEKEFTTHFTIFQPVTGKVYVRLSSYYIEAKRLKKSYECIKKACEAHLDRRNMQSLGDTLAKLAESFLKQSEETPNDSDEDQEMAKECFKRASLVFRGLDDKDRINQVLISLSETYSIMGLFNFSLYCCGELLKNRFDIETTDQSKVNLYYKLYSIYFVNYFKEGEYEQALFYMKQAEISFQPDTTAELNQEMMDFDLKKFTCFLLNLQFDKSRGCLNEALEIAKASEAYAERLVMIKCCYVCLYGLQNKQEEMDNELCELLITFENYFLINKKPHLESLTRAIAAITYFGQGKKHASIAQFDKGLKSIGKNVNDIGVIPSLIDIITYLLGYRGDSLFQFIPLNMVALALKVIEDHTDPLDTAESCEKIAGVLESHKFYGFANSALLRGFNILRQKKVNKKEIDKLALLAYKQGKIYSTLKREENALEFFDRAIELQLMPIQHQGSMDQIKPEEDANDQLADIYFEYSKIAYKDRAKPCYEYLKSAEKNYLSKAKPDYKKICELLMVLAERCTFIEAYGESNETLMKCVEYTSKLEEKDQNYALIYFKIARNQYKKQQFEKSIESFKLSLDHFLSKYGRLHEKVVEIYKAIAQCYEELGQHIEAANYYDEILKILEKIYPPGNEPMIECLSKMGQNYLNSQEYQEAHSYFDSALSLCVQGKTNNMIYAGILCNLGRCSIKLDLPESIEYLQKSAQTFESIEDQSQKAKKNLISVFSYLGDAYMYQEHLEEALKSYQKAAELSEEMYGINSEKVILQYYKLAKLYANQDNTKKSLDYWLKCTKVHYASEGSSTAKSSLLDRSFRRIGQVLHQQQYTDAALQYHIKALKGFKLGDQYGMDAMAQFTKIKRFERNMDLNKEYNDFDV